MNVHTSCVHPTESNQDNNLQQSSSKFEESDKIGIFNNKIKIVNYNKEEEEEEEVLDTGKTVLDETKKSAGSNEAICTHPAATSSISPNLPNGDISIAEVLSLSTILSSYTFTWMNMHTKGENTLERIVENQSNIALLSALLLTIWMSLLYQPYSFKESWQDVSVGFGLCAAVVFHFLSMVNSVILGIMFSRCKTEGSSAGKYLVKKIGANALAPMIEFYIGCFLGGFAILIIINLNYLKLTFYLCASCFIFLIFGFNALYYQYNVVAFCKAIEIDRATSQQRKTCSFKSKTTQSKLKRRKRNLFLRN